MQRQRLLLSGMIHEALVAMGGVEAEDSCARSSSDEEEVVVGSSAI